MEQQANPRRRPRRRKTQWEIIKETFLPYIFLMSAALLIVVFIVGALIRG